MVFLRHRPSCSGSVLVMRPELGLILYRQSDEQAVWTRHGAMIALCREALAALQVACILAAVATGMSSIG